MRKKYLKTCRNEMLLQVRLVQDAKIIRCLNSTIFTTSSAVNLLTESELHTSRVLFSFKNIFVGNYSFCLSSHLAKIERAREKGRSFIGKDVHL